MDERLQAILRGIRNDDLALVAGGALGTGRSPVDAPPALSEILAVHNEDRTIGIVKVSGTSDCRAWSAVAKLLDMSIPAPEHLIGVTAPENEEIVYEQRYFVDDGVPLRPAKCYLVSRPSETLKVLWLEDLTAARGAPFTLDEIERMARHFGQWNGLHAMRPVELAFPLGFDSYARRYAGWRSDAHLVDLRAIEDHPATRAMYENGSIGMAFEFNELMKRLIAQAKSLPHSLCFGDCSAGNMFFLAGETVAIDWASLTNDPLGVDGGCVIGSGISWGRDFALVAKNERALFESYLGGLVASGWHGNRDDLRRAYFGQLGFYLSVIVTMPVQVASPGRRDRENLNREFLERRFQLPLEEIPLHARGVVDVLPSYIAELKALLD